MSISKYILLSIIFFFISGIVYAATSSYPFTTTSNYTYDNTKIEFTGGNAQLLTLDQTDSDNTSTGFGGGTHNSTIWDASYTWLELNPGTPTFDASGDFTSRIMDAGGNASWDTLTWIPQRPLYKELPNNAATETDYNTGNMDMTGIVGLWHLNDNAATSTVTDSSGQGNHGIFNDAIGDPNTDAHTTTGKLSTGLSFDGGGSGVSAVTVATTTSVDAIHSPSKKHTGAFGTTQLVFFYDGNNAVYTYNDNGGGWQATSTIFSALVPSALEYTTRFSGSRVDVVGGIASNPQYRQGTLSTSGITWANDDSTIDDPNRYGGSGSSVVKDSGGFPVHAAKTLNSTNTGGGTVHAAQTDGQDPWGGDINFNAFDNNLMRMLLFDVSALEGSRDLIVVVQVGFDESLEFKFYDQSTTTWDAAWTRIEVDANLSGTWINIFDGTQDSSGNAYVISKDASSGELHIWDITDPSAGTFSEQSADITGASDTTKACISADDDDLYVFYDKGDEKIYYKKSTDSGVTWGSQNNLKTDTTAIVGAISCYEQSANNEIGIVWTEGAGSPYDVRFAGISTTNPTYISMGNVGSGIKTISFWMQADDITSRKIIDIDGTDQIEIDGSNNITATSFPGTTIIYVDGSVASTVTTGWHHIAITDTTGVNASAMDIGRVSAGYFDGLIDEVAIFSRVLTPTEILDMYKRGALRLKHQVRSCDDNACSGESFIGPDGTSSTYYSELTNTATTTPSLTLTNVSSNQYFQYKTYLESDNTASSTPELISITITPTHYDGSNPTIVNNTAPTYTTLSAFTETTGGSHAGTIKYQLSNDNSTWYYHNGSNWVSASGYNQTNTATDVNTNISTFPSDVGTGSLYFKSFLNSSSATQQVQLDNISITYASDTGGGGVPPSTPKPPSRPTPTPSNPEGTFISLINPLDFIGIGRTNNPNVTLTLDGGSDSTQMAISNFFDFRGSIKEPYAQTKSWNICSGISLCEYGLHTIYTLFFTKNGIASPVITDSVVYEELVEEPIFPEPEEPVVPEPEVPDEPIIPDEPIVPTVPTFNTGTLIRSIGGTKVYVIKNNKKRWIPTASAFNKSGYKWENIQEVGTADVTGTVNINLIRAENDPKVYILASNGKKRHIPNPEVFNSYNYDWNEVSIVTTTERDAYEDMTLMRVMGNPKVYRLVGGVISYIPDPETFNSYGYDWDDVVEMNETEMEVYEEFEI